MIECARQVREMLALQLVGFTRGLLGELLCALAILCGAAVGVGIGDIMPLTRRALVP